MSKTTIIKERWMHFIIFTFLMMMTRIFMTRYSFLTNTIVKEITKYNKEG